MPLAEGDQIAGYTVVRSLGAGGMGEVYLVQHPRLPRQDAMKLLAATVSADGEYRTRFEREAEIAATLWHPHIVEIHDRGDVDGQLWISMDYVEGTDAGKLLADRYRKGMPPDLVARLVMAVAEALDYAHSKGLTHRDVKPANVLIARPGATNERILLADFGIARRADDTSNLTGTNMTVGTVSYAAPEQLTGETVDGRADQYALAATAYELLTGAPPFTHANPAVVISQHLTAKPPNIGRKHPELSALGDVFERALAKTPQERFDKCVDFARALAHRIDGHEPHPMSDSGKTVRAQATSGPRHGRAAAPTRTHRWRIPAVVVGVLVLIAAIGAAVLLARDDRQQRSRASTGRVAIPVVVIGANCETLGAAGITEAGANAYCARIPSSNENLWSLYAGEIAKPSVEAAPGDPTYAPATETPVLVCMQQTGESRNSCHDDIARENADPAANDTLTPTP